MRQISHARAINEALFQILEENSRAFVIGQGVTSPWYVGTTTEGLIEQFGPERVIDTPVSENGVTGVATGAALAGMRPIVVHPRMDFMYYAMDQIANHAANWYYMFGEQCSVPLTIWGIVNRGGEQAAQHSQALHAMFMHIPGLKVVAPSTPFSAKGLLVASVEDPNPVLYVDDRWLYRAVGHVPEDKYSIPLGKATLQKKGKDVTVVTLSYLVREAEKAAEGLKEEGIDVEIIDLLSLKPLDTELLFSSVGKTRRLVIADTGWKTCGLAAEISALIGESSLFNRLRGPIIRVTLPDVPAPASTTLERAYYPASQEIKNAIRRTLKA